MSYSLSTEFPPAFSSSRLVKTSSCVDDEVFPLHTVEFIYDSLQTEILQLKAPEFSYFDSILKLSDLNPFKDYVPSDDPLAWMTGGEDNEIIDAHAEILAGMICPQQFFDNKTVPPFRSYSPQLISTSDGPIVATLPVTKKLEFFDGPSAYSGGETTIFGGKCGPLPDYVEDRGAEVVLQVKDQFSQRPSYYHTEDQVNVLTQMYTCSEVIIHDNFAGEFQWPCPNRPRGSKGSGMFQYRPQCSIAQQIGERATVGRVTLDLSRGHFSSDQIHGAIQEIVPYALLKIHVGGSFVINLHMMDISRNVKKIADAVGCFENVFVVRLVDRTAEPVVAVVFKKRNKYEQGSRKKGKGNWFNVAPLRRMLSRFFLNYCQRLAALSHKMRVFRQLPRFMGLGDAMGDLLSFDIGDEKPVVDCIVYAYAFGGYPTMHRAGCVDDHCRLDSTLWDINFPTSEFKNRMIPLSGPRSVVRRGEEVLQAFNCVPTLQNLAVLSLSKRKARVMFSPIASATIMMFGRTL